MPRPQPIEISVDFTANIRSVGDLLTVANVLTDLGVHHDTPLTDQAEVVIQVPVKDWSLAKADFHQAVQINITVDHKSPSAS